MLIKDKMEATKFSPAELTVIDYLLKAPEKIEDKTTQQIAKETFTQPSTLIRISKKLGFKGWIELKKAYLEEWRYLSQHFTHIDANLPFTEKDSLMTIPKKIAALKQTTIEDTLSLLHHDDLQKAKNLLLDAKHIRIFAHNANLLISEDFALKMNRIKKKVTVSTTKGESMYEAYNLSQDTCAILISYTGENQSTLRVNEALKEQSIPTIAITSIGENSLSKECDCFLPITTRERLYSKIANFTINTSIIYLLDVLYSVVFSEHYQQNLDHLIRTGKIIDGRKSNVDIMQEND